MGSISKGCQTKYWVDGYMVKLDSPGWYESVSEVLVSEVQKYIVTPYPYVDYLFYSYRGYPACKSKNFLAEGESVVSLKSLLDGSGCYIDYKELSGMSLKDTIVGVINMCYELNIEKYLAYMCYLDAIVLNEDRHLRNISFIRGLGSLKLSPIYDFGLSLLSDCDRYPTGSEIGSVKSQPFCIDFMDQVKLFDNPCIKVKYDELCNVLNDVVRSPGLYVSEGRVGYLVRATKILLRRLSDTEGILWFRA